MLRRLTGWSPRLVGFALAALLAAALPAAAQGIAKGVVKDDKGQLVPDAKVTLEQVGGTGRKFETKSDKNGEFLQVGLPSGQYTMKAEKDKLVSAPVTVPVSIRAQARAELIISAAAANNTAEAVAKNAALKKVFEAGVAAAAANNHDEAITQFKKATEMAATCADCFYNLGVSYAQKKDYGNAEDAYKKAIVAKADYSDAYSGLSTIYNTQKKFDLATEAAAKARQFGGGAAAAGGGNADALYNEGVILWNAGKIPDAKKQFQDALAANPNHAESHYQLGMALLNEGNTAGAATEFDSYLKLSPSGPNAPTAKAMYDQLKK